MGSEASRTSTISQTENERANLTLVDRSGNGAAKFTYAGQRNDLKRSYALVFDQANNTCTLEPLASSYSFNIKSTPNESSAAKLAERYGKLKPKPKPDVDAASKGATDGSNVDPNGPADEENPFDFRHFIKQTRNLSRSASPEGPRSQASTPYGGANRTPLARPAPGAKSPMTTGKRSAPPTSKRSPQAGSTLSKPKTSGTPEVRLERRASTRPTQPGKKGKSLKSITQPKKNPTIKSSEFVDSSDDDDDGMELSSTAPPKRATKKDGLSGGLEIDFGDSTPLPAQSSISTSKKNKGPALLGTPNAGPISLRSAANSAAASPAHNMASARLSKTKSLGDGQVIDFGDTSAVSNDDEESDEDSSEDAPGEADHDIEPMDLGSPAHETRSASASRPTEDMQQGNDSDADGDDDMFDDAFEEAYQQLSEADNDMPAAPPAAPGGDESEESEEE